MKPPGHLNALRAFEAAARHASFAAAATELNVTAAAVGQMVRSLEEWLGKPLFARSTRGRTRLVSTEVALQALPEIQAGFDRLNAGLERLQEGAGGGVLAVTVSPAFAAKWLLPRFERFQAACPDTDMRLETSLKPIDFVLRQVDIGVLYGTGAWPGLVAEKLMTEEVYPVASPELLQQRSLRKPGDLGRVDLIHDLSMDGLAGFPSWSLWLQKMGASGVPTSRGVRINNSAAVLQAACEGRGVALARSVMARDDLAAGRLVRLFPKRRLVSGLAYYVVFRPESAGQQRLLAFRDWLFREAGRPPPSRIGMNGVEFVQRRASRMKLGLSR